MPKSGECQFFRPCATAGRSCTFVNVHPQTCFSEGDSCCKAIRPRADDDRVRSITHAVWRATAGTVLSRCVLPIGADCGLLRCATR